MAINELHSSNIQDIYTLSPLQQGMYFHALADPGSTAYVSQLGYRIHQPLDPACIRSACAALLQRHDVLRTVFSHRKTDEVVQIVLKQRQPVLHFEDLRNTADAAARIEALMQEDRQQAYDLSKDLLLRLYVLQINGDEYALMWSHHHILMDGWCAAMLLQEFNIIYAAHASGRQPQLPPAPPYADFIRWLGRQDSAAAAAYWAQYLDGYHTRSTLPQLPVSARRADAFAEEELAFDTTDSDRIRALANDCRVTPNIIFQGVWSLVFARYTGADDVVFGSVTALRPPEVPHVERMIGLLINTVPVRARVAGASSPAQLFAQLQADSLRAQEHTHYPLAQIQSASPLRQQLIDTLFITENFGDAPADQKQEGGLSASIAGGFSQTNYDLNLVLLPGAIIRFRINYNTTIYRGSMIGQLLRHFRFVLEGIINDPHRSLEDLPLMPEEEVKELLALGTGMVANYTGTIASLFRRQALATPDAIALRTEKDVFTYNELHERSNALAAKLSGSGVKAGACVGVLAGRSVEGIVSLLAVATLGAIYLPLEPGWPDARLEQVLQTSGATLVLIQKNYNDRLAGFEGEKMEIDRSLPTAPLVADGSRPGDTAYLIFTSGTTGAPKGVPIRHESIASRVLDHNAHLRFGAHDRMLQFAAVNFDASLVEILMPLFCGGTLCLLPDAAKQDLSAFHEFVERAGVTTAILPPAFIRILDRHPLPSINKLISTGEAAIRADLVAYAATKDVYNGYGPTEVCIGASFHQVRPDDDRVGDLPIGRPFADTGICVVDRSLRLLPRGAIGEICISGIGLSDGYWQQPELTRKAFVVAPFGPRLYRTGDQGRWNASGELEYLGRIDDQVQINGIRVEVGEIRACLRRLPYMKDAQVRLVQQDGRQLLTAYFIAHENMDVAELRKELAQRLPAYMMPACFFQVDAFPLSPNGKIDWSRLPQPEPDAETEAPARNDREALLFDVVASVLQRPVSGTSDFFRLGGDSIKAIQVVSRLHRKGWTLTVKDIFEEPTLNRLEARMSQSARSASQAAVSGPMPLTPIVAEFLALPLRDRNRFNQGMLLQSEAPIDTDGARTVFQALYRHHDGLRLHLAHTATGWQLVNEGPEQEPGFDVIDLRINTLSLESAIDTVQRSMDLEHGPLFKATIFRTPQGDRLLLLAHHLVVDGISWRILLEDLEQLYRQARAGQTLALPPKTDSFKTWAEALSAYAQGPEIAAQQGFWRSAIAQSEKLPSPAREAQGEAIHSFALDHAATTALLEEANAAYHTETPDLLISALGMALQKSLGLQRVCLTLEGHGREPIVSGIDVSRTVGWFTSLYPFVLPAAAPSLRYLQSVKEALRAIPHRGIGWGIGLHLSQHDQAPAPPSVLFNYLGQFRSSEAASLFAPAAESAGVMTDPDAAPFYPVAISARVTDGRLSVTLRLDKRCFDEGEEERLGETYRQELSALIARCCAQPPRLTPSDTDLPQLSVEELDAMQDECARRFGSELEAVCPLTPMQEGMLFHCLAEPSSEAYLYQVRYRIAGKLDRMILEEAVQQLVARHSALRTVFRTQGTPLAQLVLLSKRAPVRWIEAPQLDETDIDRFMTEDAKTGFRLDADTLLRLSVFQENNDQFTLVWTSHHLVLDGWCLNILLSEFASIYTALLNGLPSPLPPAAPFRNYVRWIAQQGDTGLDYWTKYLDGYTGTALLPTRRSADGRHEKHIFSIDESGTKLLNDAAQALRVSLSTLVQTTWGLLLARYNDAQDVVFGSVTSGRPPSVAGIETMIGLFINTLPLRVRFSEETPFGDLARTVQSDWLNAERYQHCPLAQIQSAAGQEQGLVELVFDFTNYPAPAASTAGTQQPWKLVTAEARERTHYAFFTSAAAGKTLDITFHYDTNAYESALVHRLGEQFRYLLQQVADNKWTPVGALRLLRPEQELALLDLCTGPSSNAPIDTAYATLFEARVAADPDADCILADGRMWTYGEVDRCASAIAARLQQEGLREGGIVAIGLERGAELIASVIGIWKAGGVYLPIHGELPADRVRHMLEQSGTRYVIDSSLDRWPADVSLITIESINQSAVDYDRARSGRGEAAAYLLYTSGSTGLPKGVVVAHRGLMNHLFSRIDRFDLKPGVRVAQTASQSFDISIWQMMAPLLAGAAVIVFPRAAQLQIEDFLNSLHEQRVQILQLVPSYADQLLSTIETVRINTVLPEVRIAILVGEELKPAVAARWHRLFPGKLLLNTYGPTEAADTIADYEVPDRPHPNGVPVGRPIENTRLYVLDRQRRLAPQGAPGEIFVSGPGVGPGYLNAPEKTAAAFSLDERMPGQRLYATGDQGSWDEEGLLRYHGRRDHQVKINGHRVELGEIENALLLCPCVVQAVVLHYGESASEWKGLAAYVRLQEDTVVADLTTHLRTLLPAYMIPAAIIPVETFPTNINGKVDRKRLLRPQPVNIAGQEIITSSTEEELLLAIWREVLGNTAIGLDDHFIEAGGDSIRAMQVSARCHAAGYRADLNDFFAYPTIRQLALRLHRLSEAIEDDAQGLLPLTPIQARFFSLPFRDHRHYNQSFVFALPQRLEPAAAQALFDCLLHHHDALRTRFPLSEGQRTAIIDTYAQVRVPYFYWRASATAANDMQAEMDGMQKSFDLEQGPLFRAALFSLPDGDRLFVVAHHLVIDGVSWRILHEDMNTLLRLYLQGQALELPRKTSSYRRWALTLAERRNSSSLSAERAYWHALLEEDQPPFPAASNLGNLQTGRAGFHWESERTRRFVQSGNRPNELLLAAFTRALYDVFGLERVLIDLELHGREQLDAHLNLSRTIGWFTTLHPVLLKRTASASEQTAAISRALAAAPQGGIGYGLLRYLPNEEGRCETFAGQANILFNYLGQFDTTPDADGLAMTADDTGAGMGREETAAHDWNVSGFVADGCLRLSIDYRISTVDANRMDALSAAWERALLELLDTDSDNILTESPPSVPFTLVADEDLNHIQSLFNPGS